MAKGRTRSSGRGVGNASFCFRKLERFIVMLIWASTLQRPFRVFVKVRAKIHFERVLHSWRGTHTFDAFLRYRAGIYPGLENGIPLVSIVSIFILRREAAQIAEKNFAFCAIFRAVTLRFDRSSSLENPLLPLLARNFSFPVIPIAYFQVYRIPRWKNFKLSVEYVRYCYSSSSSFFPVSHLHFFFISRNNPPSNEKIPGNISLSNPRWLAVESKNLNNPVRVIHFHE